MICSNYLEIADISFLTKFFYMLRLRHFWYGVDEVTLPRFDDLPPDEYHICEQFARHHKANCVRALTEQER